MFTRIRLLTFAVSLTAAVVAAGIVDEAGVTGGLIVHVGCDRGAVAELTAVAESSDAFLIHLIDTDAGCVAAARKQIMAAGVYGRVSTDMWDGKRLPYASGSVNVVVSGVPPSPDGSGEASACRVSREEVERVLAPRGVWLTNPKSQIRNPKWTKPVPGDIDEWSHYLHDADNNAVAHDARVGPSRSPQWIGSPRWSRHHDRMASMSALVTASGATLRTYAQTKGAEEVMCSRGVVFAVVDPSLDTQK